MDKKSQKMAYVISQLGNVENKILAVFTDYHDATEYFADREEQDYELVMDVVDLNPVIKNGSNINFDEA